MKKDRLIPLVNSLMAAPKKAVEKKASAPLALVTRTAERADVRPVCHPQVAFSVKHSFFTGRYEIECSQCGMLYFTVNVGTGKRVGG